MNTRTWPLRAIVAGIALMLIGPLFISFAPTQAIWTNADQAQYQKAAADLHASTFQLPQHKSAKNTPPTYDPVAAKTKYEAAKAAYDQQAARLSSARSRPTWLSWMLRVAGILLTAFGLYGHFTSESTSAPSLKPQATPITLPAPPAPPPPATHPTLPPGSSDVITIDGPPPKIDA